MSDDNRILDAATWERTMFAAKVNERSDAATALRFHDAALRAALATAEAERDDARSAARLVGKALEVEEARVGALTEALRVIRDLPNEHDLLHNAVAKAMHTYAARALLVGEPEVSAVPEGDAE